MGRRTGGNQIDGGQTPKPPEMNVEAIISEHQGKLDQLAAVVQRVGKQSTADAFALGKSFFEAKALLPKKAFSVWLKATCTYTVRSAWNYASVHEKLADLAPNLEAAAIGPTVLFELAKGEREQITSLLDEIEAGKQLSVAQVKARLRGEGNDEAAHARPVGPGLAGLNRLIEQRQQHDKKLLAGFLREIAKFLTPAVETARAGKRVTIASMKSEIELALRHASELLRALAQPMRVNQLDARRDMVRMELEDSPAWQRAISVLKQAEYSSTWPDGKAFQSWLVEELHPAIEYILEGTPWPSDALKPVAAEAAPAAPLTIALPTISPIALAPAGEIAHG